MTWSRFRLMVIALSGFSLGACAHVDMSAAPAEHTRFIMAIKHASVPQEFEISETLVAITDDNPQIRWRDSSKQQLLVVTWKSRGDYEKYLEPERRTSAREEHVLWVTAAPQVKEFCQALGLTGDALSHRIKQYLGLSPERRYDLFVELWVGRHDLFRPCPDPETNDRRCDLSFGDTPEVSRIDDYKAFFKGLYFASYHTGGVPWTRLGYTYDWSHGEKQEGASEFVVAPDSPYVIEGVHTSEDYCRR